MKVIFMILSLILLNGCGTVLTPKTKEITINSERPVEVWLNDEELVSTGKVNIFSVNNRNRKGDEYIVLKDLEDLDKSYRINLDRKFNRMTLLNIPLLFGIVGYPVDVISGATGKLEKTNYEIDDFTLEKLDES